MLKGAVLPFAQNCEKNLYYDLMRGDLFRQHSIPGFDINSLDSDTLCSLLLCRSKDLNFLENRFIMEASFSFINAESVLIELNN